MKTINSGDSSELITSMTPATTAGAATKYVLYSIDLNEGTDIAANDVIYARAIFEVTSNESTYNTGVFSQLILATSATATTGQEVSEANGRNLTPNTHHDTFVQVGDAKITDTAKHYLNCVVYCVSSSGTQNVTVEQDFGRLSVDVQTGVEYVIPTPPSPPVGGEGTVLNQAFNDSFGNIDTYTTKVRILNSGLTKPSGTVTKIRFKLQGHPTEPLTLAKLYFGPKASSGDAWDASTLYQLQVSASNAITVPAASTVWTDWLTFSWDKTSDLIFSMYCNGGGSSDALYAHQPSSIGTTWVKGSDTASTANDTGMGTGYSYLSLVTGIETDGF